MGLFMKVAALANRTGLDRFNSVLRKEGIRHEHGAWNGITSIELIPNFSSNPNPKILQSQWRLTTITLSSRDAPFSRPRLLLLNGSNNGTAPFLHQLNFAFFTQLCP